MSALSHMQQFGSNIQGELIIYDFEQSFRTVLLKLWSAARYRASEVWLPGRGLTPKIVFCTTRAFILTLSLKISFG